MVGFSRPGGGSAKGGTSVYTSLRAYFAWYADPLWGSASHTALQVRGASSSSSRARHDTPRLSRLIVMYRATGQLPVTEATTSPQIRKASSTCDAETTSGGTIRTTFEYAPQVSSSKPLFDAACCTAAAVAVSGRPSAVVNSVPTKSPSPRTSPIDGVLSATSRAPSISCRPRSAAFSTRPSSWMTSSVASAAAHETALPPYVPPCEPGHAFAISSSEAAMADNGNPLARPFAVVTMSGLTPKWSCPQNLPVRPN